MFGTIRRHQTWLWIVIITLTIISFVVFFSPYSKVSSGTSGNVNLGSINGKPVSREDFRDAQVEVYLHYFFTRGDWPDKDPAAKQMGFNLEQQTYQRLLLIEKEKGFNIHVSDSVVGETAANILRSFPQKSGVTSLETFEQGILRPHGFTMSDFERFLRHQVGLQQMSSVIGMSGTLVAPQEAEALYRHEHEEVATEAVFFPATNYLASVSVTPEALGQFYTNRMSSYRIHDRVQVSYVKFNLTNFFADADKEIAGMTNLEERVEAVYQQRGTNYYREAKSPAEAKEKIKEEGRREFALAAARKKAAEFANALFDQQPFRAENLEKLATEKGLTTQVTAPFDQEEGPQDIIVPQTFTKSAFKLTEEEPFGGPIVAEDGVYIFALKKKIPSEIPSLDSIRDKVTDDYKFIQAVQLARAAGESFYATLTNGLAQGKTFSAIADETNTQTMTIPLFSLSTRSLPEVEDRISIGQLQNIAFTVAPGKISNFIPTANGGLILHVKSRLPVNEEKLKKELPGFLTYLRQTRQNEAFNDWFRKQMDQGLRDTPLARAANPATRAPVGASDSR